MKIDTINNNHKKLLKRFIAVMTSVFMILVSYNAVYANAESAPYYGFGTTNGRTDTININDYHTNSWERFVFNYLFESGGNYRYDLRQPTTYTGTVPNDVYTVNVRRDKNVTFKPPSYGVFSGNVATTQTNYLFEIPLDPAFANYLTQAFQTDPNIEARFDTLMQGVNAGNIGNPMDMHDVGSGTLANTSVGGDDIVHIGGNNTPSSNFEISGFLPPTSIND